VEKEGRAGDHEPDQQEFAKPEKREKEEEEGSQVRERWENKDKPRKLTTIRRPIGKKILTSAQKKLI